MTSEYDQKQFKSLYFALDLSKKSNRSLISLIHPRQGIEDLTKFHLILWNSNRTRAQLV